MFRTPMIAICLCVCLTSANSNLQEDVVRNASYVPQGGDTEKELFRKALKNEQMGDLENAYLALKLAFEKRRGKEHKEFSPLFSRIKAQLANKEADKGRDALSRNDYEACENHIRRAKSYDRNTNVENLEQSFNQKLYELQMQLSKAKSLADANDFEQAGGILRSLLPFEKYLPGIQAEIVRIDSAHRDYLVFRGWDLCTSRRWKEATDYFQRALLMDPANERAKEGIERIDRGIRADLSASKAEEYFQKGLFRDALHSIDLGVQLDPGSKEVLLPVQERIIKGWIENLEQKIPVLIEEARDFSMHRDAFNLLGTLRDLRQDHPLVVEKMPGAARNYGYSAWEEADKLSQRADMSRVATSYALMLSARERLEPGTIRTDRVKELANGFNRKRAAQVVVSIENLCAASEKFQDAIQSRAMSIIEKLGLPDLRVRTLQDYMRAPDEDTQFQEFRPDGKSYTALLIIQIHRYGAERNIKQARQEKSTYLERIEEIQNPEWLQKSSEIIKLLNNVGGKRNKISERERALTIQHLQLELEQIPKTISKPIIKPYEYQIFEYTQISEVKLAIMLKDRLANIPISATEEIIASKAEAGREITGVHSADQNGLQNLSLRMSMPEEALSRVEREVGESMELKLADILTPYAARFIQEGKNRLDRNQVDEAVENFLCHYAFVRGQMSDGDASMIQDLVRRETGFDLNRYRQEFFSLVSPIHTLR